MLAAIDAADPDVKQIAANGHRSVAEWAEFWDVCWHTARKKIKKAVAAGQMKHVKQPKECDNGIIKRLDGYIWVGPKK